MPWRIYFSPEDFDRIEVGHTLGPLAETIMALSALRWPAAPRGGLRHWSAQARARLAPRVGPLAELIPPASRGVDLLPFIGRTETIEHGIVALMAAPDDAVAAEIDYFDENWERLSPRAWAGAERGGAGRIALADAAVAAYGALIRPYWSGMTGQLRSEQASKNRIMVSRGGPALLASLQSRWIRWNPPVLEVDNPSLAGKWTGPIFLRGSGIRLVPSPFTGDYPSVHVDLRNLASAPTVTFAARSALVAPSTDPSLADRNALDALARLIGRTRAVALSSIGDGCTTTELAARIGTSIAAASQHAGVLRDTGLVITNRQGSSVLHTLTPLGTEVLAAGRQLA
ncbi:MAG TPA: helix-turn-helix domain-containing protein [Streptosporangiaceae bacterium]|jgi:DNA-binding transcriptional ArsR family regulator|nr:helix-turn-helix domain-containing protein [Streptosporangiaceae bacterium]